MGWWAIRKDTREFYDPNRQSPADDSELLTIGDEPMDVLESALRKVARVYRRDLRRRPTAEELSQLLQSGISILEDEVFDDMEEREVESVVVKLRQRPKRPRPKPGDYFAIPLPSGGYGYGRVIKVTHRILLWLRLLNARTLSLATVDDVQQREAILDLETGSQKIDSLEWPIIGHLPLSDRECGSAADEPRWITTYPTSHIEKIAEWRLAKKQGLPPNMGTPYEGYRDS